MKIDKALVTNVLALLLVGAGFLLPGPYRELVLSTGLFALSGAITNWLAVHMLFEKVPGLYGSGVIPARFEEFKGSIKDLIMDQFFDADNVARFFSQGLGPDKARNEHLQTLLGRVDLEGAFESLVDVIMESSFGSMLSMLGGRKAMQPLKEPFIRKMQDYLARLADDEILLEQIRKASAETLSSKVELIVELRLNELTPELVKEIVQRMIREHLGWLVVWGGVIGGSIGLLVALLL